MRGGFLRQKRRRRFELGEDVSLQITSMADVFMIILVFLLKTYSTGITPIVPPQGMKLPEASRPEKIQEALKVEISNGAVRLDGQPVTLLQDYKFRAEDVDSSGLIVPLRNGFSRFQNAQTNDGKGTLLVLADQDTPYSTLKTVLNTAALTGWKDFKLVVVEDR